MKPAEFNAMLAEVLPDAEHDFLVNLYVNVQFEIHRRRAKVLTDYAKQSKMKTEQTQQIVYGGRVVHDLEWVDYCHVQQELNLVTARINQNQGTLMEYPILRTRPPVAFQKLFSIKM